MRHIHSFVVLLAVAVVCSSGIDPVHAEQRTLMVDEPAETHRIRIHPERPTTIKLSSIIVRADYSADWKVRVDQTFGDTVVIFPHQDATPEQLSGTLNIATRLYSLVIVATAAPTADQVDDAIVVKHRQKTEIFNIAVNAEAERKLEEQTAELTEQHRRKLDKETARFAARVAALKRHHSKAIEALKKQHSEAIEALKQQHSKAIEKLKEQHSNETEELQAQHAQEIDRLTRQINELTAYIEDMTAKWEKDRAKWQQQLSALTTRKAEQRILEESIKQPATIEIPDAPTEERVEVVDAHWVVFGSTVTLHYVLENHYPTAYRVGDLQLLNEHRDKNHAGEVKIEHKDDGTEQGNGVLASIPPRGRVKVAMMVREPERVGRHVALLIREPDGERPAMRQSIPTWHFKEPADENEGRTTLSLQGIYGAMWLGDGVDLGELEPTSLKGVGARLTYGLTRRLNLEIDAVYASTGEARFADVPYGDDTQGDLLRSARLGRVQGGLMARFGEGIMPTVRLGLGLQGASHDAEFTPVDGGAVREPDVGFEFSATVHFGAGLDVRLGEHLVAGFGLSTILIAKTITAQATTSAAIEAGAHLGYAWTP